MSFTSIPASDLRAGDVLHYDHSNSWLVLSTSTVGKSVDIHFEYLTADWMPSRVGKTATHRMRASTVRQVNRTA